MITREEILELAKIQPQPDTCALSFYFQPRTPQDGSHRDEAIEAKEVVRRALKEVERNGKSGCARADLDRILRVAENLHGNQARAKAIFASGGSHFWREFDLPPQIAGTQLFVNRRFHLRPLAELLGAQPALCVTLVDRRRGRLFDLRLDELVERDGIFHALPRRRTDGYAGYDAGHAERRIANEAMQHYKAVAERLQQELERGAWQKLIVGCHEQNWPEFEPQLHPYVRERVIGRFSGDFSTIREDKVREQASRLLRDWQESRRHDLLNTTLDQAFSNSRGVTGLRRVLKSFEMGEVQTVFIGENFQARVVECTNCGHLDSHLASQCAICGRATRELDDVCDALIPNAIRLDTELFYIKDNARFEAAGNIAAMLRFRADQNRAQQAQAS